MSVLIALLLGLLQGLSEFLPISSSGHLLLLQHAFGIENPLFFSIMLHLATLAAVFIVMRKDIRELIRHPLSRETLCVLLTSVVTAALYFALKKVFDDALENPMILGWCFLITAVMLFTVEGVSSRRPVGSGHKLGELRWRDAAIVGVIQSLAILPGVSRSGATLTGSLFCGLERKSAARFAFLISIPPVLGSFLLEVLDFVEEPAAIASVDWVPVLIGMAVAFAVGVFALKIMLKHIEKISLRIFGLYVGALGLFILLDQFVFHLIPW